LNAIFSAPSNSPAFSTFSTVGSAFLHEEDTGAGATFFRPKGSRATTKPITAAAPIHTAGFVLNARRVRDTKSRSFFRT
jgi:hypothetical protein